MTQLNDQLVRDMVEKVLQTIQSGWGSRQAPTPGKSAPPPVTLGYAPVQAGGAATGAAARLGQFTDVDEAVAAAQAAQAALARRSLAQREEICNVIRRICIDQAEELGRMEYEETRIGHPPHKGPKMATVGKVVQGVEWYRTQTGCFSGDHGITLEEHGPWGVIAVVTPVTHSLPTLACNAVQIIAAGNALVCNPHPSGRKIAAHGAKLFNQAIYDRFGIDNLICVITNPTIESANALFRHRDIPLICVTGGPGVVAAALKSGKRAVCAGPGNPPVVVDASADIDNAARCIIEGATFDNNLLCLSEKEIFVEAPVYESFMAAMEKAGAVRLTAQQMNDLGRICLEVPPEGHAHANKKFVGAEACVLAQQIGLSVPPSCRLLFGPTPADHPWVQAEQMMPCLPVVKADTFEQAVDMAKQAEHGFGHTAVLHSRLVDHMTAMGKAMNTTLFVKNGPSVAGNGAGGEGYASFSIACTTGEGITTPLTFTRFRRCIMVDNLRIV